jgi:antitoxin MazE
LPNQQRLWHIDADQVAEESISSLQRTRHGQERASLDSGRTSSYIVGTMKARLIRIGNSRGVRLPKPVIEEAGLQDEVEVRVREGAVVISSRATPRAGWAEAARKLRSRNGDRLLDQPAPTRFDEQEWRWR